MKKNAKLSSWIEYRIFACFRLIDSDKKAAQILYWKPMCILRSLKDPNHEARETTPNLTKQETTGNIQSIGLNPPLLFVKTRRNAR